ncbi:MAG: hypothetical protein GX173_07885 [Ruminococcaceae bacterium]|nr:hypothetical protein [Oscillospiraceae bacterium]
MSGTPRIKAIFEASQKNGLNQPVSTFLNDLHQLGRTTFHGLEKWEKLARSMAGALEKQPLYIDKNDRVIGRIYHLNACPVEDPDPDFDYHKRPDQQISARFPEYEELLAYQLAGRTGLGHITWAWNELLRLGTRGLKAQCEKALENPKDETAEQFYKGVLILLTALENWNRQHVALLEDMGMNEMAAICKKVPEHPADTFHEAVQVFFIQHIFVMRENPFGGNGPGRLDYYLWPYLEKDLQHGRCTLEQARELIDELFIRLNERIYAADGWVEAIVVGGSFPDGRSAVNPLSGIMIESISELNITHPSVYVRMPEDVTPEFLQLCVKYIKDGTNRAQSLSDKTIIRALTETGVPYYDAVEYTCGGCMEIGIQGMTSDFLFNGWHNIPKIVELCVTGGRCLKTGNRLRFFHGGGLSQYRDFELFYQAFIDETSRILNVFFDAQDIYSAEAAISRPSYLISAMVRDCILRGRNMHDGGARYHDYGSAPIGLPNAADYLFAIKKAVFDEKICSPDDLIKALQANFSGFEPLRKKLLAIAKYGQENTEADQFAARLFSDISKIYTSYRNRFGGRGKIVILTFVWSPEAGKMMGATADGHLAGKPVAHGVTPQSSSMGRGITAAMNSCTAMPFHMFNGGASTMWDLDPAWATEPVIQSLLLTFFANGGQIYQGNTTDVAQLLSAQEKPDEHHNLIVRVGGYSARFVNLNKDLQNEIITRMRHH